MNEVAEKAHKKYILRGFVRKIMVEPRFFVVTVIAIKKASTGESVLQWNGAWEKVARMEHRYVKKVLRLSCSWAFRVDKSGHKYFWWKLTRLTIVSCTL